MTQLPKETQKWGQTNKSKSTNEQAKHKPRLSIERLSIKKLVPWGTDGRLPLSDLDLDFGSGHTAYRRASLIDLYLHTEFH